MTIPEWCDDQARAFAAEHPWFAPRDLDHRVEALQGLLVNVFEYARAEVASSSDVEHDDLRAENKELRNFVAAYDRCWPKVVCAAFDHTWRPLEAVELSNARAALAKAGKAGSNG